MSNHIFSTDKCKFMDSKMRPLWMVWKNYDTIGGADLDFYVMYKNGDGEEHTGII